MARINWKVAACAGVLSLAGFGAQAATISYGAVTNQTANATSNNTAACNAACVASIFGTSTTLDETYKQNAGGSESGTLAGSYAVTFSPNDDDASGFMLTFTGGTAFSCPECYLVVKDGNHSPAQYFFNLGNWNGTATITGTGFWPAGGAISHVAIFGGSTHSVPEPSTLALLGLGLLGVGFARRRKA